MASKTPSFVTELPLVVSQAQEQTLLARLEAARQVYNGCLGEALRRRDHLLHSSAYQTARGMKPGKERSQAFSQAQKAVGFVEYALHDYAGQFGHEWLGQHLDSLTVQKLASRAFDAVEKYHFGQRGRPRFMGTMDEYEFDRLLVTAYRCELRVTLLGYKTDGRGALVKPRDYSWWLKSVLELSASRHCPTLSIDTALALQYDQQIKDAGVPDWLYHTSEGQFSCYIDAVNQTIAPSSYDKPQAVKLMKYDNDEIRVAFQSFHKGKI